jgi:TatD DNase family protein
MKLRFFDAHNHLQDDRFGGRQSELMRACEDEGLIRMVVNGACEEDWPLVAELARQHPQVLPSFGYHPWYQHERTTQWRENLLRFLDQVPSAIGEIGLDRWKPALPYDHQEEVFVAQLTIAAQRNLPASIHCLQAWGRMLELLKTGPRPARGFLLHSYGGPREMIDSFAELGAYFSLPGYYAHERKEKQRETFRHVPIERLLVETDDPDQMLPNCGKHPLIDLNSEKPINHPANIAAVYDFAAELRGVSVETLSPIIEQNFLRLFGGL